MEYDIQHTEELSFNAWPALETLFYAGWILRFANGYTRRANSVNPIYATTYAVDDKITRCEAIYSARGQKTVFKITPAVYPTDLDDQLAARGYVEDARTSVQTLSLAEWTAPASENITLEHHLTDDWLALFCRLNNVNSAHYPTMKAMLTRIVPQCCFSTLHCDGQPAAVGLGVRDGDYIGLFDIVTESHFRNRGLGNQLVSNLLYWGKQNDAKYGYLQVMLNNSPALHLYHKLGYREIYQYWYRVKDLTA